MIGFNFTHPHKEWILGVALAEVEDEDSNISFQSLVIGLLIYQIVITIKQIK